MEPVACHPFIKGGKSVCTGSCPLSVVEFMGIQLQRSQPRAGFLGKNSRDRTSLSQTSYLPKVRGKRETGVATPLPSCLTAVETPLPSCLGNQAWSLGVIHLASNRSRMAKMQSWRTAQRLIKPRSTRRSRQTKNIGKFSRTEEHRALIYGDSFKSKMQSLDIPALAKSDRKTEELSGAGLERDRIDAEETSGNSAKMDRG